MRVLSSLVLVLVLALAGAAGAAPLAAGEAHARIDGIDHWYRVAGAAHAAVQLYGFEAVSDGPLRARIHAIVAGGGPARARADRVWKLVDSATVDRLLFHRAEAAALNRRSWAESKLGNSGLMFKVLVRER